MKELDWTRFISRSIIVIGFVLFSMIAANAQCAENAETALYNKFLENFKGSPEQQKTAYQVGKDYIAKFGNCSSDNEKKITDYVQKWLAKYDSASVEFDCANAVNATPEKAFDLCQPYIAKDPGNLHAYLLLVLAGTKNTKTSDAKFKENSVHAARRALDLIASGKTTDNWLLGKEPADAIGAINYYAGYYSLETAPADAQTFFSNAAKSGGNFSKEPAVYDALARAIYINEYKSAATEYNSKCTSKPVSECDALYAKAGQVLDKVIDAYARAVALSKDQNSIATIKNYLTVMYKQRHNNSEEGLDKLLTEILSKPLP